MLAQGVSTLQDASEQPNSPEPPIGGTLGHPKRREIFEYLTQKGGADEGELVEALDLPAPRLKYHLSVLESADLIAHVEDAAQGTPDCYVVA
jgi:hypothetical protein